MHPLNAHSAVGVVARSLRWNCCLTGFFNGLGFSRVCAFSPSSTATTAHSKNLSISSSRETCSLFLRGLRHHHGKRATSSHANRHIAHPHTSRWFARVVWLIGLKKDCYFAQSQRHTWSPTEKWTFLGRQSPEKDLFLGLCKCAKWPAKMRHAWNTSSFLFFG